MKLITSKGRKSSKDNSDPKFKSRNPHNKIIEPVLNQRYFIAFLPTKNDLN